PEHCRKTSLVDLDPAELRDNPVEGLGHLYRVLDRPDRLFLQRARAPIPELEMVIRGIHGGRRIPPALLAPHAQCKLARIRKTGRPHVAAGATDPSVL